MKLTDVDLNELLPIYAQGQPIANAIGEAVASAIGAIFGRCVAVAIQRGRGAGRLVLAAPDARGLSPWRDPLRDLRKRA